MCKCYLKPRLLTKPKLNQELCLDIIFYCTVCGGSGGTVTHYYYCEFKGCDHEFQYSRDQNDSYRHICKIATKRIRSISIVNHINPMTVKRFMSRAETKKIKNIILQVTGKEIHLI